MQEQAKERDNLKGWSLAKRTEKGERVVDPKLAGAWKGGTWAKTPLFLGTTRIAQKRN